MEEKGLISICRDIKERRDRIEQMRDETYFVLKKLQKIKEIKEIKNHLDEIEIHIDKCKKKYEFFESEWNELNEKYINTKNKIIENI